LKVFEDAARVLGGTPVDADTAAEVTALLSQLQFEPPQGNDSHLAALFAAAARMSRIFELRSQCAPGLACVGGTADPPSYGMHLAGYPPADVSGRGSTMAQAFRSCVGEAIEYLSLLTWGDEHVVEVSRGTCFGGMRDETAVVIEGLLASAGMGNADQIAAVRISSIAGGREAFLPAALGRRSVEPSTSNLVSRTGCAAGPTIEHASLSALLELIERDAAALWWLGGRQPHAVSTEVTASNIVAELTIRLRAGGTERRTSLLDITTDLGVPCVAAVSTNREGHDFACGLAARTSLEGAACSALLEMCQMELANHLVHEKLKHSGVNALTPTDRRHKLRFDSIIPEACGSLFAALAPVACDLPRQMDVRGELKWVAGKLEDRLVECFALDLTRPEIGVPCVRAFAPALQPLQAASESQRLARTILETGGSSPYAVGIPLL
jgi:ribosomal protein S12 methylthiotransferase accessory factor